MSVLPLLTKRLGFEPTVEQCETWLNEAANEWKCKLTTMLDEQLGIDCIAMMSENGWLVGGVISGKNHEERVLNMFCDFTTPLYKYLSIVDGKLNIHFQP